MNKWENQVDPKVKKEINDEGFEGNAAVLIGKKEDMPNLENKLESEGKAVDLATYIKLNKIVAVSAEEMEKEAEDLGKKFDKGDCFLNRTRLDMNLYYVDMAGNLAKIEIDFEKIDTLKNEKKNPEIFRIIKERLSELGFSDGFGKGARSDEATTQMLDGILYRHESRIKEQMKQEAKDEFNF